MPCVAGGGVGEFNFQTDLFQERDFMAVSLFNIPGAFHLPRVNWDLVRDWVEQNIPLQNRTQAWSTIAQEWLEAVNHTLGGTYQTIGSEKIILLVPADFKRGAVLLELAEAGLRELAKLLGGTSSPETNWSARDHLIARAGFLFQICRID